LSSCSPILSGSSSLSRAAATRTAELRGIRHHDLLLDFEQLRRMHRKLAQAHAQQQPGQLRVAGHFAAHGNRHADPLRALDGLRISLSTAGCSGS
jgi:hypothetical protein